ncbi:glyoxylate/hydroxypyruvate reductase A [Oxalobacteraceae bacterium CAVE-383]|nr:glyoxylate/hydroxypyruvate reductase A [Oxalobacteraceae bacterium CAVE-383]
MIATAPGTQNLQILFYNPDPDGHAGWLQLLREALPGAVVRLWQPGDSAPADYALVWQQPAALLEPERGLKAVFNLGAGVDAVLKQLKHRPDLPLIRIDDGAMAIQMAEYACYGVLHYFRQFDRYGRQARDGEWTRHAPLDKSQFTVGILGLGVLGSRVAQALRHFDFPVLGWTRGPRPASDIQTFHGAHGLGQLLRRCRVAICMLPLTEETRGLLNRAALEQLPPHSYIINVARGAHLVQEDLLALIRNGHLAGAMLDVFDEEPLPPQHPFWHEPCITITPHISAKTVRAESIRQVAQKIAALECGESVTGLVDRNKGY